MISSVNNNLKQQKMDKETVNQQIINGLKSKGIFIGSISPDVLGTFANIMYEAINYTRCCTELNPEFAIGEQVLLTKNTVVTIETFCEDGMIEIDDNNEYYKVDKDELTKRV